MKANPPPPSSSTTAITMKTTSPLLPLSFVTGYVVAAVGSGSSVGVGEAEGVDVAVSCAGAVVGEVSGPGVEKPYHGT